ncbi:MAG TPA: hypothetical protein VMB77_14990 [Syntrophales bacterium]|nr:hypothetical protein [Syntrophales bacterium]
MAKEEIQEDGGREVNEEVHGMISKDISASGEIIQPETEIRQNPGARMAFRFVCDSVKCLADVRPRQALHMDIAVLEDVVEIIEVPFAGKTVPVYDQQHDQQRENGEQCVTPSGLLSIPSR